MPQQDRTEKLVSLTHALTTTRVGYTRAQLRDMVDDYAGLSDAAFERKFERDKDTLRNLGVVLTDARGRDVAGLDDGDSERRYRVLASSYPLPAFTLTPTEAAVLGMAAKVVAGGGLGRSAERAAERLGVVPGPDAAALTARLDVEEELLEPLLRHVTASQPIAFTYTTADGRTSKRRVVPWGLGHRHGHWYLAAGDVERDGQRLFRLDRITGAVAQAPSKAGEYLREAYGRPERFSMSATLDTLDPQAGLSTAVLLAAPGRGGTLAARAERREPLEGGLTRLTVRYSADRHLAAEVAGEGLRVVSPASLAAAVASHLAAAAQAHTEEVPTYRLTKHSGGRRAAEQSVALALDLVAWVVNEGAPTPQQVAEHFELTPEQLEVELTRLRFCGVPNGMHDELLDVEWDASGVRISNAEALARPMNLNLAEAASLLMGLDALAALPSGGLSAPIRDALESLTVRLRGLRPELADFDDVLAVRAAASDDAGTVIALAQAIDDRRVVSLDYAAGSHPGPRRVHPVRLLDTGGRTYLQGWSEQAEAARTFRLDRVLGFEVLPEHFAPDPAREAAARGGVFTPSSDDLLVEIGWRGSWRDTAGEYGPERTAALPGGGVVAAVRVRDPEHLVGLTSRAGGDVVVLAPEEWRRATRLALFARAEQAREDLAAARSSEQRAGSAGIAEAGSHSEGKN